MPNPNSPYPPRLSAEPVPLPEQYQQGDYAGAAAVYDLDRVLELPYIRPYFSLPPKETATDRAEREAQLAAQHRYFAEIVAYCCAGLVREDGSAVAGTDLDDIPGWASQSRNIVLWLATKGLAPVAEAADAPFQTAATD